MTSFDGFLTTFREHHVACREPRRIATDAIRLWPTTERIRDVLVSGVIDDVLLTSDFVPIDVAKGHLFVDQSYTGLADIKPVRFATAGDRFHLDSTPVAAPGRYVVIGGPVDRVWYHWLFSWCPRMLVARMLRPDLFASKDVRFVVHPCAMIEPYRSILDSFGLKEQRFFVVDPERDYRLEQACLVSFLDQNKLFPTIMRAFSRHLVRWFGIDPGERTPGVFASRQGLPAPKRRIANFPDIEPVLQDFGLEIASLGSRSAAEQVRLFHQARTVVGAHGSDLANLLFCRPGTTAIVIENELSVARNLHVGLLKLAEMMDLRYHLLLGGTADDGDDLPIAQRIGRDYLVDRDALRAALLGAVSPQAAP